MRRNKNRLVALVFSCYAIIESYAAELLRAMRHFLIKNYEVGYVYFVFFTKYIIFPLILMLLTIYLFTHLQSLKRKELCVWIACSLVCALMLYFPLNRIVLTPEAYAYASMAALFWLHNIYHLRVIDN